MSMDVPYKQLTAEEEDEEFYETFETEIRPGQTLEESNDEE